MHTPSHHSRREFLAQAGTACAALGYSVLVEAGEPGPPPEADIRSSLDALGVEGASTPPAAFSLADRHLQPIALSTDICIAGGGMAGVCAALAAARNGARVILVQDRSRLGGNASSEVRMHIVGADCSGGRPGWREGGIIEELRLEFLARNSHCAWELWDLLLYDKLVSEPNVTLLLDTFLTAAEVADSRIQHVLARSDKTEHLYQIKAAYFMDCTGDCRLGLEAGASLRTGHEDRAAFDESLAPETAGPESLGSSILFTSKDYGKPMPFVPPSWARKITREQVKLRNTNAWEYGYWWIEWGGQRNAIWDNERIRFELLSIVLGVWDYIKNSGEHPESLHWAMDWVGMIPGKRASRRLDGPHILTQQDCLSLNACPDAVAIGGWPFDDHPSAGFDASELKPANQIQIEHPYSIPLRCLFSANIKNLFMAGRNISASHVAFTSTRVMATCSVAGQAAGTAAAHCLHQNCIPEDLVKKADLLAKLQQRLLRQDQTILGLKNEDPEDLARKATAVASSEIPGAEAKNVLNGETRSLPSGLSNQWQADISAGPAWIELQWDALQELGVVQLCFDSGFERPLTLTEQLGYRKKMILGPQPELVRDYTVACLGATGEYETLAEVTGNFQRLRNHTFPPVRTTALRVTIGAAQGVAQARIFEIRAYAS